MKIKLLLLGWVTSLKYGIFKNWEMRQTGGSMSTEILDVVLPESIKEMSF